MANSSVSKFVGVINVGEKRVRLAKKRAEGEAREKEDIIPSHRGTAEPIWLADFYEKISPRGEQKGKKKERKKRTSLREATAGMAATD
jgi:hypothetical protein